ncbi:MAG: DUF5000 domain-containing lipoprotein [Methanothrix sp.]
MTEYVSQYPTQDNNHVKATSYYSSQQRPYFSTDPTKSLTGNRINNQWYSLLGVISTTNQRFHIDLGAAKIIKRVYYENSHNSGLYTNVGIKNFTLWGSNDPDAFADLTFADDTGWTQLTAAQSTFDRHVSADQADPKYILITNEVAYRYFAFKFADNYGNTDAMGVRRIELQSEGNPHSGIWYLNANGYRLTATLASGAIGTLYDESSGITDAVDNMYGDADTLIFRRVESTDWQWYRGKVVEGIFVGRFAVVSTPPGSAPTSFSDYTNHVTGWNATYIDADNTYTRIFDITCNGIYHGILRLDKDADGRLYGQLKFYASMVNGNITSAGEELESDLNVTTWDGTNLVFLRYLATGAIQIFEGTVSGRTISGTYSYSGSTTAKTFTGTRAVLFTYGLVRKSSANRTAWQDRVRAQLQHLMMAGNPTPTDANVTTVESGISPIADGTFRPSTANRDDDIANHSQAYTKTEFDFEYAIEDEIYGGSDIARLSHGFMTIPTTSASDGGYPAIIVVNGHGSPYSDPAGKSGAWRVLDPNDGQLWYGDAWARRGYVVLAIDIGHREVSFDAAHGNNAHPAITSSLFTSGDSDWEQDGERAWDVMQALTLLLAGSLGVTVDSTKVLITGLSLGGEVTTFTAAFDTRLVMALPAGFSPDLNVMRYNGNCTCYQWTHASIWEYIDTSVLHALIAPRPLIVQTGASDPTFSARTIPFSADLQELRRSGIAYNKDYCDGKELVHYLQPYSTGEVLHQYRCGDHKSTTPTVEACGLSNPAVPITDPCIPKKLWWMTDYDTVYEWQYDTELEVPTLSGLTAPTLFDYVDYYLECLAV